jgi:hypothetical protein
LTKTRKRRPAATKPATATYVYGVARAASLRLPLRAPRLPDAGKPRALDLGDDLWLVVCDAPLEHYDKGPLERGLHDLDWVSRCALAHQGVIAELSRSATVAPMQLFTLFASDRRAEEHLRRMRARIEKVLDRVAGHQEWGVRLRFDAKQAQDRADSEQRKRGRPRTGRDFLALKNAQKHAGQRLLGDAVADGERLFTELGRDVAAARRRELARQEASTGVLLDAAFLVSEREAGAFKRRVSKAAARMRERGIALLLTGPWPAYSFLKEPARAR